MIQIKKVLNSSVVLVDNKGQEMVAFGKGIGYGKKNGDLIEHAEVDQLFLPIENPKARQILSLVDSIPYQYFDITDRIIDYAKNYLNTDLNPSIYFALTDHLNFAVERVEKGLSINNRVLWEIKNYYPKEFHVGQYACQLVEQSFDIRLPEEEAANIAFHLINGQQEIDEADGMKYAKMIGNIVNLVRYSLNINVDTESIHYKRFITHVKFFVERFFAGHLLNGEDDSLYEQLSLLYPQAMTGAQRIKEYVQQVYKQDISNDEVTYLAVHINRLLNSEKK